MEKALKVMVQSLKRMRYFTGSQWRKFKKGLDLLKWEMKFAGLFHQPTYLINYLVPLQNSRLLRSLDMLTVPRFRTKWGSRAFAVAAPSTWNSLPVNLRTASTVTSFKKMLKTFLFDSASPPPPLIPRRFWRPVDDLRFDSRHWAGFDLDSAPLSSHLRGFRRYRSYRIEFWIEFEFNNQMSDLPSNKTGLKRPSSCLALKRVTCLFDLISFILSIQILRQMF